MLNRTLYGDFFTTSYYTETREMNFLAHHFSPSTILLLPFYFLSTNRDGYAWGLFIFSLTGLFLYYRLALLILKDKQTSFLLLFMAGLNVYLYRVNTSYHFEAIFPTLFFAMIYFLEKGNRLSATLTLITTLTLKEDIPAYMFLFFFYYAFQINKKIGVFGMIGSLAVFFIIPKIQISLDHEILVNWKILYLSWGNSYPEIVIGFLSSPGKVSKILIHSTRLLMDMVMGTGLIWIKNYRILLVIIPIITLHLFSDRLWHNEFKHYYSYTFIPFIMYGVMIAIFDLLKTLSQNKILSLLFFLLAIVLYRNSSESEFPIHFKNTNMIRVNHVQAALALVPENTKISIQFDLGAFASRKLILYPVRPNYPLQNYILLDTTNGFSPYYPIQELEKLKSQLVANKEYKIIYEKEGITLMQSVPKNSIN